MSALYDSAREGFLTGGIDWSTDDIRVALVDTDDYTFSAAHTNLTDVPSAARVAVSGSLSGKTTTGGVADAADVSLSGVTGDPIEALVVYRHTDGALVAYIDGVSLTPNGGTVTVTWDDGANKIFKL